MPELSKFAKLAIKAAQNAGKEILKLYEQTYDQALKAGGEPVTDADIASDEIIVRELSSSPYPIVSEENVGAKHSSDYLWLVDPLDGTKDFLEKTGEFSVMISLLAKKIPILGVVYRPSDGVLFVAEKNIGAYRNALNSWEKLEVSPVDKLSQARCVVSRHHLAGEDADFLNFAGVKSYKKQGSAGLKISLVAQGDAEIYFTSTNQIKLWDTAAGSIILSEAGGKITDLQNTPLNYDIAELRHKHGILVSNGKVHEEFLEMYAKYQHD